MEFRNRRIKMRMLLDGRNGRERERERREEVERESQKGRKYTDFLIGKPLLALKRSDPA